MKWDEKMLLADNWFAKLRAFSQPLRWRYNYLKNEYFFACNQGNKWKK